MLIDKSIEPPVTVSPFLNLKPMFLPVNARGTSPSSTSTVGGVMVFTRPNQLSPRSTGLSALPKFTVFAGTGAPKACILTCRALLVEEATSLSKVMLSPSLAVIMATVSKPLLPASVTVAIHPTYNPGTISCNSVSNPLALFVATAFALTR